MFEFGKRSIPTFCDIDNQWLIPAMLEKSSKMVLMLGNKDADLKKHEMWSTSISFFPHASALSFHRGLCRGCIFLDFTTVLLTVDADWIS
jgi:hypothetical protein